MQGKLPSKEEGGEGRGKKDNNGEEKKEENLLKALRMVIF